MSISKPLEDGLSVLEQSEAVTSTCAQCVMTVFLMHFGPAHSLRSNVNL